jgi:hypothetical protein
MAMPPPLIGDMEPESGGLEMPAPMPAPAPEMAPGPAPAIDRAGSSARMAPARRDDRAARADELRGLVRDIRV